MKIEDHPAFTGKLPRICYILGGEDNPLKPFESFSIFGAAKNPYHFNDDTSHIYDATGTNGDFYLPFIINHPEKIIRQPQFSEDDKTVLKALFLMGYKYAARDKSGILCGYMVQPYKDNDSADQWWADEDKWSCSQNNDLLKAIQWNDTEPFDISHFLEGLK